MKSRHLILGALAIALIWGGVHEHQDVARLQAEHERLAARASALGVSESEIEDVRTNSPRSGSKSAAIHDNPHLKDDLVGAFRRLKKSGDESDPEARAKVGAEVRAWIGKLIDLSPKELKQVVEELSADSSLNAEDRKSLLGAVLTFASTRQSEEAAELALAHRESGVGVRQVVGNWAVQDPAGAFAWLEKNKEAIGKEYPKAWEEAVRQSVGRDPALALKELAKMADQRSQERLAGNFAANLADDSSRMALLEELRHSPQVGGNWRLQVWKSLGNNLSKESPDSSALVKGLSPGEAELISGAILSSGESLDHAGAWLDWSRNSHVPVDPISPIPPLLTNWINEDYQAAGEWINKQPAGDFRNQAIADYARQMAKRFPDTAKDWANTLPEGPDKRKLLEEVGK